MGVKLPLVFSVAVASLAFVGCGDDAHQGVLVHNNVADAGEISSAVEETPLVIESSSDTYVVPESSGDFGLNPGITYGTMVDERDGQTYKTITIGYQTWMAQNLNFNSGEGSTCYENNDNYCSMYGRLYTWGAAMDSARIFSTQSNDCGFMVTCEIVQPARGICPDGWYIPVPKEWQTLFDFVGAENANTLLSSSEGWMSSGGASNTNAYGFSVLPAGQFKANYYGRLQYAGFWGAFENDIYTAYSVFFNSGESTVSQKANEKYGFLSVRCIKF